MPRATLTSLALLVACALAPTPRAPDAWFEMRPANRGPETYSAWFADTHRGVLYFGMSAFWHGYWAAGDDPRADLAESGDQLIGRFDLARERFLAPLLVGEGGAGARSSVWDVLAHSNGRVYYTTYYEQIGSIAADGSDPRRYPALGSGWNELYEGPGGRIYASRYSSRPLAPEGDGYGSVGVIDPDGRLLRELRIPSLPGQRAAPKSLAVDPANGEIWLNTDTFAPDGEISHETVHLSADGRVLARSSGEPELHFVRFDAEGRGWFAESEAGALFVRVVRGDRELRTRLGTRPALDFVQDIQFAPDGSAVLARWSGVVHVVRERDGVLEQRDVRFSLPTPCTATGDPALLYSAFLRGAAVYASVYCRGAIARRALEE